MVPHVVVDIEPKTVEASGMRPSWKQQRVVRSWMEMMRTIFEPKETVILGTYQIGTRAGSCGGDIAQGNIP